MVIFCYQFFVVLFLTETSTVPECTYTARNFVCVEFVDNYDGDTATFNIPNLHPLFGKEVDVCLKGIDTAEIRTSDECEKTKAQEAKNYLHRMLKDAETLQFTDCERGKYFRIVCDVIADGQNASEILLHEGLAVKYSNEQEINWCEF